MRKKVFVGLSGGVDSSVAALRLLKQGYDVTGVFIKVWQPEFLRCNWEQERLDAMRVAAHLRIPFLTCDAEEEYRQSVGEYFINEYKAGRTPNPDVMCNKYVKFGAFLRFAKAHGADFVATGHYAQVKEMDGQHRLYRGVDTNKDQSYFLWTLTQEQLSQTLFPVGDTPKEKIREEAEKAGLPTAVKKDSQGVCFLGHIDIPDFLSHFVELQSGAVLNTEGERIGTHCGALVYTLGQRHGYEIEAAGSATRPHYVVGKDLEANTITVDTTPPKLDVSAETRVGEVSWTTGEPDDIEVSAQFRYRQTPFPVELQKQGGYYILESDQPIDTPSSGQSAVFYHKEECLGGGVII